MCKKYGPPSFTMNILTRDRSIEGHPFTNLCGFMAIHHQQCRWSQDKSVPVKGKKKARHQYRVITMLRHFPSDEPSPGFHWATISLFPSGERTLGVSSTVFHQGQRHQANHQQWPDLQEGSVEGKWALFYLSPTNVHWSVIWFCFICQIYEDMFPPPHQYWGNWEWPLLLLN